MKFFSFKGRASRSDIIIVYLFRTMVTFFIYSCSYGLLLVIVHNAYKEQHANVPIMLISLLTFVCLKLELVIQAALILQVTIRRLHDINLSGWWVLLCAVLFYVLFYIEQFYIVSILGAIFLLILVFKKGTKGPNRFGDDPLKWMDSIDRP